MLSRILEEFEQAGGPATLAEIGRRLEVERSALEGMLQFLVRKGKLRKVRPGDAMCAHCGSHASCSAMEGALLGGTYYELVR